MGLPTYGGHFMEDHGRRAGEISLHLAGDGGLLKGILWKPLSWEDWAAVGARMVLTEMEYPSLFHGTLSPLPTCDHKGLSTRMQNGASERAIHFTCHLELCSVWGRGVALSLEFFQTTHS